MVQLLWLYLDLKSLLDRFHEVERYIQSRRQRATKGMPSVYRQFGAVTSFAVQYFEKSRKHQDLYEEVLRDAAIKHREKCEELAKIKAEYNDLIDQYRNSECEFEDQLSRAHGEEVWVSKHNPKKCSRCVLIHRAEALSITLFERPVSDDLSIAKATIFELQPPELFCSWRDLGLCIQDAILEFQSTQPKPVGEKEKLYGLEQHADLSKLLKVDVTKRRLLLKSKTRGKSGTWKRNVSMLEEKDVCIKSSLKYAYFDKSLRAWSTELDVCAMRTQEHQYKMPGRSKLLERFLLKTPSAPDGPSTNEPLVCQPSSSHYPTTKESIHGADWSDFYRQLYQIVLPTFPPMSSRRLQHSH